jgi:Flp pilus assembly protein TadG
LRSGRRALRGQSLVEFAIVVPLVLLLLFALIDFSRLLFTYVSLANGARDLSRMAAISTRTSAGSDGIAAFDNLTKMGGSTNPATSITLSPSGGGSASCSGLTSSGCTFNLTYSSDTALALTAVSPATGSGTVNVSSSGYTAPSALGVSGNGDFLVLTWLDAQHTTGAVQICPLGPAPLIQTTCAPSVLNAWANGFVQVDVNYTFNFNPLFQNRLASVVDVSFIRQTSQLTTSARTYLE